MKLNLDCVRDILLTVESNDFGVHMSFNKLCEKLPKYKSEEIHYCCLKLSEANLLQVVTISVIRNNMPSIKIIKDLTYPGHEFLADIKSDNVWTKIKSIALNVGSFSIHAIKEIAVSVTSDIIKSHL